MLFGGGWKGVDSFAIVVVLQNGVFSFTCDAVEGDD